MLVFSRPLKILTLGAVLSGGVLFFLLRSTSVSEIVFSLSLRQLVLVPLVIALWAVVRVGPLRLPVPVIAGAVLFLLLNTGLVFFQPAIGNDGVVVAQLINDERDTESHILYEEIKATTKKISFEEGQELEVGRNFAPLRREAEAQAYLKANKKVEAVVWGRRAEGERKGWVTISFRQPGYPVSELKTLAPSISVPAIGRLKLVTSVPSVGLSLKPQSSTAEFITALAAALALEKRVSSELEEIPAMDLEQWLLGLSKLRSHWTSNAHLAWPRFRLGNLYLQNFFETGSVIELSCAHAAYESGLHFLKPGDNPELQAALFNNLGVTRILLAEYADQPWVYTKALQAFQLAQGAAPAKQAKQPRAGALPAVKRNIALVRSLVAAGS